MAVLPLDSILSSVSKIKLRGGVVGKISTVLIVAVVSLAAIAAFANRTWLYAAAVAIIFVLVLVFGWRLINFADRNPQAALLEGAEFLRHEEIAMGVKGQPVLQPDQSSEEPSDRPEVSQAVAAQPDDPAVELPGPED